MPDETAMATPPHLLILIFLSLIAAPAGAELSVDNARVRDLIPGQDKTVGYFDATNTGTSALVIVGASAASVRAMEIHTTIQDGDIMRMRRLREVVVAPGATVRFEPGGNHLMLFGVKSLDDTLDVELELEDGSTLTVPFETIPFGH